MSMRTYDATQYASPGDYQTETNREEPVSVFDRYSSFDGTFNLTRDLRVEGQVKGTITCQGTFLVAEGAQVSAAVEAENITVAGDLDGDVVCRGKLQILSTGKVRGKITTASIAISEGAFYEGELVMESAQDNRPAQRTRTERPSAQVPSVSTATAAPISPEPRASETAQSPSGGSSNTFIRRFGGQETTWDSSSPDDTPERDT